MHASRPTAAAAGTSRAAETPPGLENPRVFLPRCGDHQPSCRVAGSPPPLFRLRHGVRCSAGAQRGDGALHALQPARICTLSPSKNEPRGAATRRAAPVGAAPSMPTTACAAAGEPGQGAGSLPLLHRECLRASRAAIWRHCRREPPASWCRMLGNALPPARVVMSFRDGLRLEAAAGTALSASPGGESKSARGTRETVMSWQSRGQPRGWLWARGARPKGNGLAPTRHACAPGFALFFETNKHFCLAFSERTYPRAAPGRLCLGLWCKCAAQGRDRGEDFELAGTRRAARRMQSGRWPDSLSMANCPSTYERFWGEMEPG